MGKHSQDMPVFLPPRLDDPESFTPEAKIQGSLTQHHCESHRTDFRASIIQNEADKLVYAEEKRAEGTTEAAVRRCSWAERGWPCLCAEMMDIQLLERPKNVAIFPNIAIHYWTKITFTSVRE